VVRICGRSPQIRTTHIRPPTNVSAEGASSQAKQLFRRRKWKKMVELVFWAKIMRLAAAYTSLYHAQQSL
jgi:hypothetical protein